MIISDEGIAISNRFFEAIEMLKTKKKIRGLQTFTREHNLNRWSVNQVKFYPNRSVLKPEWIVYLHKDYGISVEWIVLGKGDMFDSSQNK